MGKKPVTYVLLGHGQDQYDPVFGQHKDVVILRPVPGETVAQLAARIVPPANVILSCHGTRDGRFMWNKGQALISYAALFRALPAQGVESVSLMSCYGSSVHAEVSLKAAPQGMIIQASTGRATVEISTNSLKFAAELGALSNPVDLLLEALDNFNPERYRQFRAYLNQKRGTQVDTDPIPALPHLISIGGDAPVTLDLIAARVLIANPRLCNRAALQRAVRRVQDRFDTDYYRMREGHPDKRGESGSLGAQAEKALDQSIAAMAQQLARGYVPVTAEETRLAYAVTLAYLDEAGEIARYRQMRSEHAGAPRLDAAGRPMNVQALKLQHHMQQLWPTAPSLLPPVLQPSVTAMEAAYLRSVHEKLKDDPECLAVLAAVKRAFMQSGGDDRFEKDGPLHRQLQAKGVQMQGWVR